MVVSQGGSSHSGGVSRGCGRGRGGRTTAGVDGGRTTAGFGGGRTINSHGGGRPTAGDAGRPTGGDAGKGKASSAGKGKGAATGKEKADNASTSHSVPERSSRDAALQKLAAVVEETTETQLRRCYEQKEWWYTTAMT
ncbi:hypothetical protein AALP_AAs48490U000100 [Arabis alpina]|uniref:Uncharacterized protein n=1 Tax=Arabis alpina TaxID=50452 RepID=A0A087G1C0_ARAAL|nr:hypothetical protein AALP_AAs48490U000100 [Arabis alpina]